MQGCPLVNFRKHTDMQTAWQPPEHFGLSGHWNEDIFPCQDTLMGAHIRRFQCLPKWYTMKKSTFKRKLFQLRSYADGVELSTSDQAVTLHVEPTFSRYICSPISAAILLMTIRSLDVILNWRPPTSIPRKLRHIIKWSYVLIHS